MIFFQIGITLLFFAELTLAAVKIDPELINRLSLDDDKPISVLISLKNPYDLTQLPQKFNSQFEKGRAIAEILENHTQIAISKSFPFLKATVAGVQEVTPLWLTHSIKVTATPEIIERLTQQTWSRTIESIELEELKEVSELLDDANGATLVSHTSVLDTPEIGWGVQKLRAPELWNGLNNSLPDIEIADGRGVTVAVIDSGANINHPDLKPNIWKNPGEIASNGIDDDNNGYIDDVSGYNFDEKNNNVMDIQGHGSQSAGIVGGMGASGKQTGVAPKATLMIIKSCCKSTGTTGEAAIWQGMQYAIKNGAEIISMSLSIKHASKPSYTKWRRASETVLVAGVIHINSAGNRGNGSEPHNIGAPASNPAAWFHSLQTPIGSSNFTSMITIGATDKLDKIRDYSSVGPVSWEDIAEFKDFPYLNGNSAGLIKPEVCGPSETPSTSMDGTSYTKSFGGTSSATPHIAGVAALLLSAKKGLTPAQMTEALQMSAIKISSKDYDNLCGAGRVDAVAALNYIRKNFR